MTHTTEPWHNSPLPEGVSHAVTVPPGRGGGALEAPQDRHGQDHRTGTSRAEQITETMAKLGALEAMAVQGAQETMAVQGAQETMAVQGAQEATVVQGAQETMAVQGAQEAMAVQGAQEAMAVQGAQEAMAGGLSWPWPRPSARPLQSEPFYPPKKISLGKLGGIRSPPRLDRHDSTWTGTGQPSRVKQTGTGQPTGTGSPPGLSSEAEASSGHDMTSGALTGSLSNRFHDKGAGS